MDYIELYEIDGGWSWRRIAPNGDQVDVGAGVYGRWASALEAAVQRCGHLRGDEDPDKFWVSP